MPQRANARDRKLKPALGHVPDVSDPNPPDLAWEWQASFGMSLPPCMVRSVAERCLVYRRQEFRHGGLSAAALRVLTDLAPQEGARHPALQTRHPPEAHLAWPDLCGDHRRHGIQVREPALSQPFGDRPRDHRHRVVGATNRIRYCVPAHALEQLVATDFMQLLRQPERCAATDWCWQRNGQRRRNRSSDVGGTRPNSKWSWDRNRSAGP